MTEMLGSDETPPTPTDRLNEALIAFTGCVGEALDEICSYGLTIGDSYMPFAPDDDEDQCTEEEFACSQAWVRVMSVAPTGESQGWGGDCALTLRLELEVGVLRCIEVASNGAAPTATDVLLASMQAMEDMNRILCAAVSCNWESTGEHVFANLLVGQWTPASAIGGQYGGTWTFSAEF